jgi:hypothetical protein
VVDIDVVTRCFTINGISAFVGVNSVFGNILDVVLVKPNHFGWQSENGHTIDAFVTEKTPSMCTTLVVFS